MVELVRSTLDGDGTGSWAVWLDGIWCYARPPGQRVRAQGWKLHLAATRSSAVTVLHRAVEVIARHGCAFKFASSLEQVSLLNSRHYPRGGAGKFITVYPDDDQQFATLAAELDKATDGLAGPSILSDRPYRAGSLVHYRFGAFKGKLELSNDGDYRTMLVRPDGSLVEDRRDAWFSAPGWATPPLAGPEAPASGPGVRREAGRAPAQVRRVLLGDRFVVGQAIRHANKGGVFRAVDSTSGAEAVVKQARPHVEATESGSDVRDGLRHEAAMLDRLAPLGVAPRKLDLFEQDGHLFLAEELLPGVPLRRFVGEQAGELPGMPWQPALELARSLTDLIGAVHSAGVVLRDLSPGNVIVGPDGRLGLIDLELAAEPGADAVVAGTPGYVAPEQLAGQPPSTAADLYSLGAILFLVATGTDPAFLEDRPRTRQPSRRAADWLAWVANASPAARLLGPLVLGLLDELPARRWNLERACVFLVGAEAPPPATATPARTTAPDDLDRLITDGIEHLLGTMTPSAGDRLWPTTCSGSGTDPCAVQHGAAGVIEVLVRAARLELAEPERLRRALADACAWVERRLAGEPKVLPGLHFGRAGTVWALHDAAVQLGDRAMAARALERCRALPVIWPNPDVTHGAAGAGLTHLHLWSHRRGDPELRDRVLECADALIAAVERPSSPDRPTGAPPEGSPDPSGQVLWSVPASFDSRFAGTTHYGFAHGLAGIAWFLLAAGLATGRAECLELAGQAGETLVAAAHVADGAAWWRARPADPPAMRLLHWCHGASGVGTFLARLARATGNTRARQLAELAGVAVRRARWQGSPAACHGLAGNGDFLLDLAAELGEPRYRAWAGELAEGILAQHAIRDGRMLVPDDTGKGVAADFGGGLAGVLAFLIRLRHGGQRLWMADEATRAEVVAPQPRQRPAAAAAKSATAAAAGAPASAEAAQ